MTVGRWAILALIVTPLLILARDAYNRRRARSEVLLALGVVAAVLANVLITLLLKG